MSPTTATEHTTNVDPSSPSIPGLLFLVTYEAARQAYDVNKLATAFDHVPEMVRLLPKARSPQARLGSACRSVVAPGKRFMHAGREDGSSRWILTDAEVTRSHVKLEGDRGCDVSSSGTLAFDIGFRPDVQDLVTRAYQETALDVPHGMLNAAFAQLCSSNGGQRVKVGDYLFKDSIPRVVLDSLIVLSEKLDGLAYVHQIAEPARFTKAVEQDLSSDIDAAISAALATIARLDACDGTQTLQTNACDDGTRIAETASNDLITLGKRLVKWRSALGVALRDIDDKMDDARYKLQVADARAVELIISRKLGRAVNVTSAIAASPALASGPQQEQDSMIPVLPTAPSSQSASQPVVDTIADEYTPEELAVIERKAKRAALFT